MSNAVPDRRKRERVRTDKPASPALTITSDGVYYPRQFRADELTRSNVDWERPLVCSASLVHPDERRRAVESIYSSSGQSCECTTSFMFSTARARVASSALADRIAVPRFRSPAPGGTPPGPEASA